MGDLKIIPGNAEPRAVSDSRDANPASVHDPEQAEGVALVAFPVPLAMVDPSALAGAAITVVDDGQRVAPLVAGLLRSHGARAQLVKSEAIPEKSDGIIHLGQLHVGTHTASDLFKEVYPVAKAGATTVVTVTGLGGTHGQPVREGKRAGECGAVGERGQVGQFGHASRAARPTRGAEHATACARRVDADIAAPPACAGIGGLLGELAEELPGANVRAVDVDCFDDPVVLAGRIVAEALASGGPVAVGYCDDRRCTVVPAGKAQMTETLEPQVIWGLMGTITEPHLDPGLLLIG